MALTHLYLALSVIRNDYPSGSNTAGNLGLSKAHSTVPQSVLMTTIGKGSLDSQKLTGQLLVQWGEHISKTRGSSFREMFF